tara:strand:+ start:1018 stop:1149 length:132 start_codon:yes stop_codon:yes gene_type:complete
MYEEKISSLKKQQEQAKELFLKLQGAIELLEALEKEKPKKSKK